MTGQITEDQKRLLEKFGFRVLGTKVVHKKMDIERDIGEFAEQENLDQLEDYIKTLLRAS